VPLIFYREQVLAKSEQRARKILAINSDDGMVPEYQESGFPKTCLILSRNLCYDSLNQYDRQRSHDKSSIQWITIQMRKYKLIKL